MDNNNFKTLSMKRGPIVWDEFKDYRGHYHQRKSIIKVSDLDGDHYRDISIHLSKMNKVYLYAPGGAWKLIDRRNDL